MTEQELQMHLEEAVRDCDLALADIPAIDLYLDQILSLVADKNKEAAPRYRERELTKTMINNYSKDGLISPISGKKYSRDHIIEMLLVYALKNTLSIGEIKRVLYGAREDCGFTGKELTDCYCRFLKLKETNRHRTGEMVKGLLREDALSVENDRDFFVALLDLLSLSAYLKTVAQEMLEARYTDPDEAERERREQEKAEKQERAEKEKAEKLEKAEKEKAEKLEKAEKEQSQKQKDKGDKRREKEERRREKEERRREKEQRDAVEA